MEPQSKIREWYWGGGYNEKVLTHVKSFPNDYNCFVITKNCKPGFDQALLNAGMSNWVHYCSQPAWNYRYRGISVPKLYFYVLHKPENS